MLWLSPASVISLRPMSTLPDLKAPIAFDIDSANIHCHNSVIDLMCRHTSHALPPDLRDIGELKHDDSLTAPPRVEWKKCIPKASSPRIGSLSLYQTFNASVHFLSAWELRR